jgi:hypothetical protein
MNIDRIHRLAIVLGYGEGFDLRVRRGSRLKWLVQIVLPSGGAMTEEANDYEVAAEHLEKRLAAEVREKANEADFKAKNYRSALGDYDAVGSQAGGNE